METVVLFEGSGEELLAQAETWKRRPRLKLIEAPDPAEIFRDVLPPDVVWEGSVPLLPNRGRVEPVTSEMVRAWLDEE